MWANGSVARVRLLAPCLSICLLVLPAPSQSSAKPHTLVPSLTRTTPGDLELTGLLPGLPPGRSAFLTPAQLAALPHITARLTNDPNFPHSVRVTGIPLESLARALGVPPGSLIDALCTDRYRAHYPAAYVAQHHPILGFRIDGLTPAAWAQRTRQDDPGPFFITYAHFVPSFRVLAHDDEPQVPSNIVRLNFTTEFATFGSLAPPPSASAEAQAGFTIAKQNCLRCHFLGTSGGSKSGRDWRMLALWAREQPAFFQAYVHNPKAHEPRANMPPNPAYDARTLAALTAYFRTFPPP